ncbi:alpha/beta hydrolase [Pseudomonas sp. NPDC087803]|uniref:alpha/beta hydrolase n=1 Tax=Pseudomonas sp. NPDC087803 TaxID=3364448 RepID=UPI0037FA7157
MTTLYHGMDRKALDAAYNNTQAISDFPDVLRKFQSRSTRLYERRPCRRDLRYGEGSRQRFDWFPCGYAEAPTFIFIHGGYWQNCAKEDFAFIAEGALAKGFNVILAEYTLAPEASITHIVGEIGRLLDCLTMDVEGLGIAGGKVCLSGHSAGGHLTAVHRSHPLVANALAISALVDLEPISLCWLNDKLQLTSAEVEIYSPIRHISRGAPMIVAVGAAELPELLRQSDAYSAACEAAGERVESVYVPDCTHFSVLEDLARPDGILMTALERLA